jgi:DNA helicase II / ATP-dependent DNA helicase PcrA
MAEQQKLNSAQQAAVDVTTGPVLVVAGAGTGKTRVIIERIRKLVQSGVTPEHVLALTFTEKAAAEMLDRIGNTDPDVAYRATIATFNRFGNDLLEQFGAEYGLGRLRLLGDTGQLVFLREHFDHFELEYFAPISNPHGQLEILVGYVSLLKQQLVQPQDYLAYAAALPTGDDAERLERLKHQELARFYDAYLQLCRTEQVIDYDDQLFLTIELLKARPNILRQLQSAYQYLLVDEFQDTNPMQSALVNLLAGDTQNIMVVGDDDQSIYGWRGATLANILDFKQQYPQAKEVTLTENYRSTQAILDSAYRLIRNNDPHRLEVTNNLDKQLHANNGAGTPPTVRHFTTLDAELAWLAEDLKRRFAEGEAPGSIAILARRNQGVQKVHETLELYGIPHAVAGLTNDVYADPSVRQLLEVLKAIADPLDDMALFHALSGPSFSLDVGRLAGLAADARREHQSLQDSIKQSGDEDIQTALATIENWRLQASEQSVGTVAYNVMTESGWKQQLYDKAEQDIAAFTTVQALSKLFKTLKEFERVTNVASVQNYVVSLPLLQAAGTVFDDPTLEISDTLVNVLSVHRSKGLEWDRVYIVDCTEGSFPLRAHGGGLTVPDELRATHTEADEHLAEERRLMYVATTRARRELTLSYADQHGSSAVRKPSRFLEELFGSQPNSALSDGELQTGLELFSPRIAAAATVELPASMLDNGRFILSVSQIECWLRCPQDFYYKYVLAMPLPPAPQLGYGSLIHAAIEQIHRGRQANDIPSLETITTSVLENLPQAGYASKRSRERAHAQAAKTIQTIYERFTHDDLPVETELPFTLELADLPLTIRGRIDAVYQTGKGVEIRDFKTGTSVTTAAKAKSRATGSQQLTLYALAWLQLRGEMPVQLSLDFVETGQLGSVKKQLKSLDTLTKKLADMIEQLQAGNYPAGHDHSYCMHPL